MLDIILYSMSLISFASKAYKTHTVKSIANENEESE